MVHDLVQSLRVVRALQQELAAHVQSVRRQKAWQARGVEVAPSVLIRLSPGAVLDIGAGSVIGPYSILDLQSDPVSATPLRPQLHIGRRVAINEFNNIRASGGIIEIGNDCLIAQYVSIIASNHSIGKATAIRNMPWDQTKTGVRIGHNVWIGTHAILLPGVTVGEGSVIAAGAVVTSDIPPYAIAAGVPAAVKKWRTRSVEAHS